MVLNLADLPGSFILYQKFSKIKKSRRHYGKIFSLKP